MSRTAGTPPSGQGGCQMMNKMGGIIGSGRCNEYGQAIYDAITG